MKVCVIGGAGFVGSRVLKVLDTSDLQSCVIDINRPHHGCDYKFGDVTGLDAGESFLSDVHTIVNLAAEHRDDVQPLERYHQVNVEGARRVCEAARCADIKRIIFTSSVAIFGFATPNTSESGAPNYFNEYGKTKFLAEQVYLQWQAEAPEERSLVIVRPTVIFGPGNRGNVYNLLSQIAKRRFVMFGDGQNVKSMAYVENVAHFLVHCVRQSSGVHIYNYVDKPDLSMNDLVKVARGTLFGKPTVGLRLPAIFGVMIGTCFDFVAWLIKRPLPISSIRVKKFMSTTQFSSVAPETGFKAPFTLAEGLEHTLRYEFLEDNGDKPTYDTE